MSPQTRPGDQGTPAISTLAAPYALIQSGRPRPGCPPVTRLVILTKAITARGAVQNYRAVHLRGDGQPSAEAERTIAPQDVISTFCAYPSPRALARVRAHLRRVDGGRVWS